MFKKISSLLLSTCLATTLVSMSVTADESPVSYSYIGLGYTFGEIVDLDFSGYSLEGGIAISEHVYFSGGYVSLDSDDRFINGKPSADAYTVGVGYHTPIAPTFDFIASLEYTDTEVKSGSAQANSNGYLIGVGVRGMHSDSVELSASFAYANIESESELAIAMEGRYYMVENISLGLGFSVSDDTELFSFGARLDI